MKYLELIWAALFRHKVRTILALLSVVTAFLLFGLLDSVRSVFANAGQGMPGANRLITSSNMRFGEPLPRALQAGIREIPGVVAVSYGSMLRGTYQDPRNVVAIEAYEADYLDLYPEWSIPAQQYRAFQTTRTGALAGESLAKKYGWKVGDKLSMQTDVYQKNGSRTWTFDLVGIYRIDNDNMKLAEGVLYINWDYLDEARASDNGTISWFTVKVDDLDEADLIGQAIDESFANSTHETKTQREDLFFAQFLRRLVDAGLIVGSIMGAVIFTLIFLTGNVMAQSVRERIPELGLLKAIGFPARSILALVLGESLLLLLVGGALGMATAEIFVAILRSAAVSAAQMMPISGSTWVRGLLLAALIGLAVGLPPALRGMRLRVVDALAGR